MKADNGLGVGARKDGPDSGRISLAYRLNDSLPDPFEDIAAPPLRTTPPGSGFDIAGDAAARPQVILLRGGAPFEAAAADLPEDDDDPRAPKPGVWAAAHADPARAEEPERSAGGPAALAASRGNAQLRWAVGVGLIIATSIIALAILFRPTPGETSAPPAVATDIADAPLRAPSHAPGGAATVAETSVRLRFGPAAPAARRDAFRAAAVEAGYAAVELLPMPFGIDRARIEYFHEDDRPAAEALARTFASVAPGLMDLRDLAAHSGGAGAGRVDVWVTD